MLPNPTLDQLSVFVAVAEAGSFSAAARRLNRAQSVVSYTIANLEAQLQVTLLDRSNSRHTVLTDAGRAILEDARRMMADLDGLRARSKALSQGLEGELKVAVSVMVPDPIVIEVLQAFQQQFPTVLLNLTVGAPFLVSHLAQSGEIALGIGASDDGGEEGVVSVRLGTSFLVPAAAPTHPLAQLKRRLTLADIRDEIQIVVSDSTGLTKGRNFNVFSRRTWRVSDMLAKRQLLVGGLGWGGLPLSLVLEDIAAQRLVRLDVEPYKGNNLPVNAVWPVASPPGPAGRWLMERFTQILGRCPESSDHALAFARAVEEGEDPAIAEKTHCGPLRQATGLAAAEDEAARRQTEREKAAETGKDAAAAMAALRESV